MLRWLGNKNTKTLTVKLIAALITLTIAALGSASAQVKELYPGELRDKLEGIEMEQQRQSFDRQNAEYERQAAEQRARQEAQLETQKRESDRAEKGGIRTEMHAKMHELSQELLLEKYKVAYLQKDYETALNIFANGLAPADRELSRLAIFPIALHAIISNSPFIAGDAVATTQFVEWQPHSRAAEIDSICRQMQTVQWRETKREAKTLHLGGNTYTTVSLVSGEFIYEGTQPNPFADLIPRTTPAKSNHFDKYDAPTQNLYEQFGYKRIATTDSRQQKEGSAQKEKMKDIILTSLATAVSVGLAIGFVYAIYSAPRWIPRLVKKLEKGFWN